ncbi:MAG: EAL domain-containing protein [Pseudomonadales bacterium]|nr:EAL domain-containing protein [Pseudomonadales bacterium]MBO6597001.1 EAL domain-containing protein [Pseudomonadales bacterium]MBO6657705.1 EAL domain-containing protein [Pseudomonadales bacterium]MBO6703643.1 EAL domain-containing protein [Pseudomonadales bacterium]MBO6823813.1 EAL domain-containing protein [Pseudomonadales bacterium]
MSGELEKEAVQATRYREVLDASNTGVFEIDVINRKFYGSSRTYELVGLDLDSGWIDLDTVLALLPQAEKDKLQNLDASVRATRQFRKIETHTQLIKGQKTFLELNGRVSFDEQDNYERIIGSLGDISEQKKLEHRLRHEALHDFLTGLPNRTLLVDRIQHILTRLKRNSDLNATLLFIDFDNFKAVNDNLGHSFGDDVLVSIGERLKDIVRATDTVSRFGSDEFVILLEDPTTSDIAHMFANRLLEKLQRPLRVQGKELNPSFSVGLVLIDDPDVSVEAILGDADIAMYAAKNRGKAQVVPFDATMRIQAAKRLDIETALRQAIDKEELYLVYQPIFEVDTNNPNAVGVEALLRWSKSGRGNIAPGELLDVAEENGMIVEIGLWLVRTAAEQLQSWRAGGFPEGFFVNINLSSRHFDNDEIADYVIENLEQRELPRGCIRIEVVEGAVIRNPEKALIVIERLKNEGIPVSLDDFGTGFSSLSYLHRFPFYSLKIDRSFVVDVMQSQASQDIIAAIVVMAKKLNIRVVAEGVEHEEQLDFLRSVGCELIQGFLLARPETPPDVDRFFHDGTEVEVA